MKDAIERWAEYVRTHADWKKTHTEFIDAQYKKHAAFLKRLAKTPHGKKKILTLYGIQNKKGYPTLLNP